MDDLNYEAIRRNTEERLKKQKRYTRIILLLVNAGMFILFLVLAFQMLLGAEKAPAIQRDALVEAAVFLMCFGWATGIIFHGISALIDSGALDQIYRRQIAGREASRAMEKAGMFDADPAQAQKAKRKRRQIVEELPEVELSDDGELVPVQKTSKQSTDN